MILWPRVTICVDMTIYEHKIRCNYLTVELYGHIACNSEDPVTRTFSDSPQLSSFDSRSVQCEVVIHFVIKLPGPYKPNPLPCEGSVSGRTQAARTPGPSGNGTPRASSEQEGDFISVRPYRGTGICRSAPDVLVQCPNSTATRVPASHSSAQGPIPPTSPPGSAQFCRPSPQYGKDSMPRLCHRHCDGHMSCVICCCWQPSIPSLCACNCSLLLGTGLLKGHSETLWAAGAQCR